MKLKKHLFTQNLSSSPLNCFSDIQFQSHLLNESASKYFYNSMNRKTSRPPRMHHLESHPLFVVFRHIVNRNKIYFFGIFYNYWSWIEKKKLTCEGWQIIRLICPGKITKKYFATTHETQNLFFQWEKLYTSFYSKHYVWNKTILWGKKR